MKKKAMLALGAGAILLIGATAAASVYVMDEQAKDKAQTETSSTNVSTTTEERVIFEEPRAQVNTTAQQQPVCDDGNIVGTVAGGAAGGLIGSQIGDGSGQTAATIGGVVGGALLGQKYMPTKNVTCPGQQQSQEQQQQQ